METKYVLNIIGELKFGKSLTINGYLIFKIIYKKTF